MKGKSKLFKERTYNGLKNAKAIQRELEIQEHGKLVSLRPSKVLKSGKEYKRLKLKTNEVEDI